MNATHTTVPYLRIVAFVLTIGNNILQCVSAVTTVVIEILRNQVFDFRTTLKYGTVVMLVIQLLQVT